MAKWINKLWIQQSLAFLLVTSVAIGAMTLVMKETLNDNFRSYVNQQEQATIPANLEPALLTYYETNATWVGSEPILQTNGRGQGNASGHPEGEEPPANRGGQGRQWFIADMSREVVAATDETQLGQVLSQEVLDRAVELKLDGERIGWLVWETQGQQRLGDAEQNFLDEMTSAIVWLGLGIGFLALVLSSGLTWQLIRPINSLKSVAHQLAEGERGTQVNVHGTAEIQELATAFNTMSTALQNSEDQRRRMTADIAHELRTPVTVMRGHLEGMLDDLVPNDKRQIAVAYDQTLHLKRLIDDLHLLSMAEVRQLPLEKQAINLIEFIEQLVVSFEPLALDTNIQLMAKLPETCPTIQADRGRLQQIMGNLLTNALRHTPENGLIQIHLKVESKLVKVEVANSGVTLTTAELNHLFEPFWRADASRQRDKGGSGLGLAIAQQLASLHGGNLSASSSDDMTRFCLELPI